MRAIVRRTPCARGCSANFGMVAPMVSAETATPATAEIGVARKRADTNIEHEHRAEAVADKHDFVHRAFACTRDQRLGKSIEAGIDIRTATVNVVVGAD